MSIHVLAMRWLGAWRKRRMSDLLSGGLKFDSQLGRYQAVTVSVVDCLQSGKPFRYIINTTVNSAFHPSGVGKSSIGLSGWG